MKFIEINSLEYQSPAFGNTFTDNINVLGNHRKAYSLMCGYTVSRNSDDMQMRQFKFFTNVVKDTQASTASNTKFIVTTKIIHLGDEDDFWVDDEDTLNISYNVLLVVPEPND